VPRAYGTASSPRWRMIRTFEYLILDSTMVRAHQHAAGEKKGLRIRPIRRSVGRAHPYQDSTLFRSVITRPRKKFPAGNGVMRRRATVPCLPVPYAQQPT
jgi:hypothetical protein